MKRDTRGKFVPNWDSEAKQQMCIALTATACRFLEGEAQKRGLSPSEAIEQWIRSWADRSHQPFLPDNETIPEKEDNRELRGGAVASLQTDRRIVAILESISDAFVAFDRDWHYTYVNQAAAQLLQKTPEELIGQQVWQDVFPGLVGELPYRQLQRAMTEQIPVSWQEWGESIGCWLEMKAYPSPDGLAVYFRDVTERKQAEQEIQQVNQALEKRVAELQTLLDVIPLAIAIAEDPACQVVRVNPFFQRLFGANLTAENVVAGNEDAGFIPFQYRHDGRTLAAEELPLQVAVATGREVRNYELQLVRSDGATFDLVGHATPLLNDRGAVWGCISVFIDITERKQAEEALRRSEARFRISQDLSLDAFTILESVRDETGAIVDFVWTYVNPKAGEILQHPAPELIGQRLLEVLPGNQQPNSELFERYVRVVETGEPHDLELFYEADGILGWFRNVAVKLEDGIAIFFSDITDRKQSEIALRQSEARFRRIFECNMVPMGIWSRSGTIAHANQALLDLLGYTQAELEAGYLNWQTLTPPEWRGRDECILVEVMRRGIVAPFEKKYVHKQGHRIPILAGGASFLEDPNSGIFFAIDLRDRKRAEAEIQALNQSLEQRVNEQQTLFDMLPVGVAIAEDPECRKIRVNPYLSRVLRVPIDGNASLNGSPDERPAYRIFKEGQELPIEELPIQFAAIHQVEVRDEVVDIVHPDGTVIKLLSYASPLLDCQGRVRGVIGGFTDITDRKQAEENLRESERRFRRLVESNMFGVAFGDFTGDIRYANDYFLNMVGYTRAELEAGQVRWTDITPPEFLPLDEKAMAELRTRGVATPFEKEYLCKDGSRVPLLIGSALLQGPYDRQEEIITFSIDLTERKQAEAEREKSLQQAQAAREEAETANRIKDEFLAVLSHELRSPLNPILGWSKVLLQHKLDAEKTTQALNAIARNAKLQAGLIEDLLDVSRILRGKLRLNACPIDLASTIQAAMETVQLSAEAKSIEIHTVLESGVGPISGDSSRLQQVVWNLLSNAVKFTASGGRVEVRLERLGSVAQIVVSDTGKGIQPDFLPYVFDYFRQEDGATTRKFGGLGLGLAIVRHLVELHGGTVRADSLGEGRGATFTVRLPLLRSPLKSARVLENPVATVGLNQLRILVVDDERDMRELTKFILEQQGVQVVAVASATEALTCFDREPPDLLISDIGMPEIDGYRLMQQIRGRSPERGGRVLAIALTAYAGESDQTLAFQSGFQRHISKPIEPDILIGAIADLVGGVAE